MLLTSPAILDFYRYASPRGIPIKQLGEWTTAATPTITVSPDTNNVYFVKSIGVLISSDADLGSSTLRITHSSDAFGGTESTTLSYSNVDELISAFAPNTATSLSCNLKGHIVFDIPAKLSGSQTLTITKTGSVGIAAGQIDFSIAGWYITNSADL
jgi:hypothetical protein